MTKAREPKHSEAPAPAVPPTNATYLREYVDSTLAFHGLRPHVADQLAQRLASRVVALECLPRQLRALVEQHLRGR